MRQEDGCWIFESETEGRHTGLGNLVRPTVIMQHTPKSRRNVCMDCDHLEVTEAPGEKQCSEGYTHTYVGSD